MALNKQQINQNESTNFESENHLNNYARIIGGNIRNFTLHYLSQSCLLLITWV